MPTDYQAQLSLLCDLQKIDLNLFQHQQVLNNFPERIREVEDAFGEVKTVMDGIKDELAAVEEQKKTDETELGESSELLREREAKLYSIKTNKEYQAAIKEISGGKRLNREREDRILQGMEKIEELTQKSTQLESEYADKKAALDKAKAELKAEEDEITKLMAESAKKRPEIEEKLDKAIYRKYEFIRKRYTDALVQIENGACNGCSRMLPPQTLNEMLRGGEFKHCPSCQRLLYVDQNVKKDGANEE